MARHRIFIAINLPEEVKKQLAAYRFQWPELPAKWTKPENLHITLEFLGYLPDEELLGVFQRIRELASKHKSFFVKLDKVCYGPPGKLPPRMVWAVGEKVQELNFSPHITLGRIKTWQWRQIEPEERLQVSEEIDLSFEVNSIEVMESRLRRGGPEYTILESSPLRQF